MAQEQNTQIQMAQPRLPYHPAIQDRFGIDKSGWKALVEAVFPLAQTSDSVTLALSYCKARSLDPFKRVVHIVPIYDKAKGRMVDTVWPGIGELRTTAFRTQGYAGRDATVFGQDETKEWKTEKGVVKVTFPSFAQVTVYRIIGGQRVAFCGPTVYWMETYASTKDGAPNAMWAKRPRGQIDKCAEAAALRCAFPEELGDQFTSDDGPTIYQQSQEANGIHPIEVEKQNGVNGLKDAMKKRVESTVKEPEKPSEPVEPEDDTEELLKEIDELPFK